MKVEFAENSVFAKEGDSTEEDDFANNSNPT